MVTSKSVSQMNKVEAIIYLKENYGETADPEWSSMEVKSRIRELEKDEEREKDSLLKGLTGLKRELLVERCLQVGITNITKNTTRPELMRMLREAVYMKQEMKDTDKLRFGKHADREYAEVYELEPGYVKWVKETVDHVVEGDPKPSKMLLRFREWIRLRRQGLPQGRAHLQLRFWGWELGAGATTRRRRTRPATAVVARDAKGPRSFFRPPWRPRTSRAGECWWALCRR